jgi:TolA-binding protein
MDLSNLTSAQWWAYFAFVLELVGLTLLGVATHEQVSAWRDRTRSAVQHLRAVGAAVTVGAGTLTVTNQEPSTTEERFAKLDHEVEELRRELHQHQEKERKQRVADISAAEERIAAAMREKIAEAVKPITEWLDETSTPWKAYAGSALLIVGLAISTIVNTIGLNPG